MLTRRLSASWDMTFGQGLANIADSPEAVGQNVKSRLQLLQGEWFLDTSAGVPYLQQIAVKPANLPLAAALIKAQILGTDGVSAITDFAMNFDTGTRRLTVTCTVQTIYGSTSTIRTSLANAAPVPGAPSTWPLLGDNFVLGQSPLGNGA